MDDKRKQYLYQYQQDKLKRVPLDLTKEKYAQVQAAAAAAGESVNGYIKQAIDERMERDLATTTGGGSSGAPDEIA